MTDWRRAGRSATISGSLAGLVASVALAALARSEGRSAFQPTNATSHWLHGDEAGRVRGVDAAHTGLGFATHQASAMFWAYPFEFWLSTRPPRAPLELLRDAAVMSGVAAVVDYGIVPRRLTPGWEEVVSPRSIAIAYGALALGLAAGGLLTQRLRHAGVI